MEKYFSILGAILGTIVLIAFTIWIVIEIYDDVKKILTSK